MSDKNQPKHNKNAPNEGRYLSFGLQEEIYGIRIESVREIISIPKITPIPNTPNFIAGMINLRGKIIPVVNLRMKFAMEKKKADRETCIIVVDVGDLQVGVIIDSVDEVIDFSSEQLEPPPSFRAENATGFILGVGKQNDLVVLLLDLDALLSEDNISTVVELNHIKENS